jgi:hypothetical protein
MHILMLILIGLVVLAIFVVGARFCLGGSGAEGAGLFIWVWLPVSIANGLYGMAAAGIPLLNEIGAFIPIFGIPAAVAWFLPRWLSGAMA